MAYLCWRKLSCRLKYFPHTSQENVTSGLLWVRSCIIKLYGLVNRLWQYLQMNSHFGRILRRKSDRQSSSIRITANIMDGFWFFFLLFSTLFRKYNEKIGTSFCASRLVPVRKPPSYINEYCVFAVSLCCMPKTNKTKMIVVSSVLLSWIYF